MYIKIGIRVITATILITVIYIIVTNFFYKESNYNRDENDKEDDIINNGENLKINIKINSEIFIATLTNNSTTKEFVKLLPLTITINDHLSNEKFYNLPYLLPTYPYQVNKIENGDFMLFGSNTLVLFYDSFNTNYQYTQLGRIDSPHNLKSSLGREDITGTFELKS